MTESHIADGCLSYTTKRLGLAYYSPFLKVEKPAHLEIWRGVWRQNKQIGRYSLTILYIWNRAVESEDQDKDNETCSKHISRRSKIAVCLPSYHNLKYIS